MPWWSTLICLVLAAQLWASSLRNLDDVIGLLEKILAATLTIVVLLVGQNIVLELVGLLVALSLPMARTQSGSSAGAANRSQGWLRF